MTSIYEILSCAPGACVPPGRILLFDGPYENSVVLPKDAIDAIIARVADVDASLPSVAFQYPPAGCDLYDLLVSCVGEDACWESRIGTNGKWDVRVAMRRGQFDWDRCRQGMSQSDPAFFS